MLSIIEIRPGSSLDLALQRIIDATHAQSSSRMKYEGGANTLPRKVYSQRHRGWLAKQSVSHAADHVVKGSVPVSHRTFLPPAIP